VVVVSFEAAGVVSFETTVVVSFAGALQLSLIPHLYSLINN